MSMSRWVKSLFCKKALNFPPVTAPLLYLLTLSATDGVWAQSAWHNQPFIHSAIVAVPPGLSFSLESTHKVYVVSLQDLKCTFCPWAIRERGSQRALRVFQESGCLFLGTMSFLWRIAFPLGLSCRHFPRQILFTVQLCLCIVGLLGIKWSKCSAPSAIFLLCSVSDNKLVMAMWGLAFYWKPLSSFITWCYINRHLFVYFSCFLKVILTTRTLNSNTHLILSHSFNRQ